MVTTSTAVLNVCCDSPGWSCLPCAPVLEATSTHNVPKSRVMEILMMVRCHPYRTRLGWRVGRVSIRLLDSTNVLPGFRRWMSRYTRPGTGKPRWAPEDRSNAEEKAGRPAQPSLVRRDGSALHGPSVTRKTD